RLRFLVRSEPTTRTSWGNAQGMNVNKHVVSLQVTFSDAGSTPAASTIIFSSPNPCPSARFCAESRHPPLAPSSGNSELWRKPLRQDYASNRISLNRFGFLQASKPGFSPHDANHSQTRRASHRFGRFWERMLVGNVPRPIGQ